MKTCQQCKSDRILYVNGKTSDCFTAHAYYKKLEHDGYVMKDIGLGDDSDCIILSYCLECGQIQGQWPIKDHEIDEEEEEEEDPIVEGGG